jgi:GTPase
MTLPKESPATSDSFRSGFIALVGRPNVGKSTLLNRLIKQKLAIVSDKPQTTRTKILGIRHLPNAQWIFVDTPGIHKPKFALNRAMVKIALETLSEADLILFLIETKEPWGSGDRYILEQLRTVSTPVLLIINKIDLIQKGRLLPLLEESAKLHPFAEMIPISALEGENLDRLDEMIARYLPEGPPYFPEETVTDQSLRFLAAEIVREKILHHTREELPYVVGVLLEEFKEEPNRKLTSLTATVFVERDSQKAIVIGKGGSMLKIIGQEARKELEALLETRVFLQLWVKVKKNWREDERVLREMGYGEALQ